MLPCSVLVMFCEPCHGVWVSDGAFFMVLSTLLCATTQFPCAEERFIQRVTLCVLSRGTSREQESYRGRPGTGFGSLMVLFLMVLSTYTSGNGGVTYLGTGFQCPRNCRVGAQLPTPTLQLHHTTCLH
jgi:hypothetical protein